MTRWSFVKKDKGSIFGRKKAAISYQDFMLFAKEFYRAVAQSYESPSKVSVTLYSRLPISITTLQDEWVHNWLDAENRKRELTTLTDLDGLAQELFDQAIHIHIDVRPTEETQAPRYSFGFIEGKGLLSNVVTFYVQPAELGQPVKDQMLQALRTSPTGPEFNVGDGFEKLHPRFLK